MTSFPCGSGLLSPVIMAVWVEVLFDTCNGGLDGARHENQDLFVSIFGCFFYTPFLPQSVAVDFSWYASSSLDNDTCQAAATGNGGRTPRSSFLEEVNSLDTYLSTRYFWVLVDLGPDTLGSVLRRL